MPAQGSVHLSCLDGWRGLAVLLVLVAHFSPLSSLGAIGVELFFVLSGRLMAEMLVHREQPFGLFVWRRATRILPALSVYIALMLVVGAVSSADPEMLARSAAAASLFVTNYLIGGQILTIFQHCWSLAVEEHSYVALVLIVALARRNAATAARVAYALAATAMAIGAWRYLGSEASDSLYFRSEIRGASILLSFALCIHLRGLGSALSTHLSRWAAPIGLGGGLVLALAEVPAPLFFTLGTALLALGVNTVERSEPRLRSLLEDPLLCKAGLVSFSLYLWQQPFYAAQAAGLNPIAAVALALLFGTIGYHAVEAPARRSLNRLALERRPALAG